LGAGHYENFPVASWIMPAHLRAPVLHIYRFARTADDLADEGDAPAVERLRALAAFDHALERIAAGESPSRPDALFVPLAATIREHELPLQLFHDLLSAFSQDVTRTRYRDHDDLLDYCRRSADPVGRLLLHLFRTDSADDLLRSDLICSGLQLVNFWQDVAIDLGKGRIYIPLAELARFGLDEHALADGPRHAAWWPLMSAQISRTRAMLESGAPLVGRLRGRVALEIALIVEGGLRILEKLEHVRADVFNARPTLGASDWPLMSWRALRRLSRTRSRSAHAAGRA